MKVVGLSVQRTGRLYPPGNIPGTYFATAYNGLKFMHYYVDVTSINI